MWLSLINENLLLNNVYWIMFTKNTFDISKITTWLIYQASYLTSTFIKCDLSKCENRHN